MFPILFEFSWIPTNGSLETPVSGFYISLPLNFSELELFTYIRIQKSTQGPELFCPVAQAQGCDPGRKNAWLSGNRVQ